LEYDLEYIWNRMHNMAMKWEVVFHEEFDKEFKALDEGLQDELLAHVILVRDFGPNLGRPTVDTLKGATHANMKELRKRLVAVADERFDRHLALLRAKSDRRAGKEKGHGKKS
jgi:hypothetical protein